MIEVGTAGRSDLAKANCLVGRTHKERSLLSLGMQGDDFDPVAMFLVQLAHGANEAYRGLTTVNHGDTSEHVTASVAKFVTSCATVQLVGTLKLPAESNVRLPRFRPVPGRPATAQTR